MINIMNYKGIVLICGLMIPLLQSCVTKAYPDEKLSIDPDFFQVYNSFLKEDTFSFRNSSG